MVVAKESDVTERMMHTGGEQIQGNETCNFRDQRPRIGEKEVGWAGWTAQALFAWIKTHDEPRMSGQCSYIAPGLLRAVLTCLLRAALACPIRATRACVLLDVGAMASHGKGRLFDACFRVFARCAKKKIFNSFTSFSG